MSLSDVLEVLQLELPNLPAIPKVFIFLISVLMALIVGRYTPGLVRLVVNYFSKQQSNAIYEDLIHPVHDAFKAAGTFLLLSLSLAWLREDYASLYNFLRPLINLGVIGSVAWLISQLFSQLLRAYGIELLRRLGREVDELLLVLETIINIMIGFIAVLAFAQSQDFNLIGLMASLGIGGLAIAFAAQKILEQLISTVVLYLDRPFVPGDYIRVSLNPHAADVYGRIESIGLRSTKLRTSAKSTLVIIPNNTLANLDIENVTRGKKVMVMLYLNFNYPLDEQAIALVRQVVTKSTESLLGIDPGSTSLSFIGASHNGASVSASRNGASASASRNGASASASHNGASAQTQARVTFFILGSNEDSIQLRKRLLELAQEKIAKQLDAYNIRFTVDEPTIYVESPVTI